MARNENESLHGLTIPEADEVKIGYIDKTGNQCGEERDSVAKITEFHNKEDNRISTYYYVKCGRGIIFDPYGMDMNKTNAYNFQFKKVDQLIFDKYIDYLRTRREVFLIQARRSFISKGY